MRRREFIIGLGAAASWSQALRAEQPIPVIGFLSTGAPEEYASYVASFRQGLGESGFVERQNVAIEFRWARSRNDLLPALAKELIDRSVAVIAGLNSTAAVRAAKAATARTPIVFAIGADPVEVGLVKSFSQPGGNVTGISFQSNALLPKRLEVIRDLIPQVETIAFLTNSSNPNAASDIENAQTAARAIGEALTIVNATSERDFEAAFVASVHARADAMLVDTDPLFTRGREQIAAMAARYAIPTLYDRREFVAAGGLISYGSSLSEAYRQTGIYTAKILKGAEPSELPIVQPTKFELIVSLKVAKTLGLTVPPTLTTRADEVIE